MSLGANISKLERRVLRTPLCDNSVAEWYTFMHVLDFPQGPPERPLSRIRGPRRDARGAGATPVEDGGPGRSPGASGATSVEDAGRKLFRTSLLQRSSAVLWRVVNCCFLVTCNACKRDVRVLDTAGGPFRAAGDVVHACPRLSPGGSGATPVEDTGPQARRHRRWSDPCQGWGPWALSRGLWSDPCRGWGRRKLFPDISVRR